MSENSQIRALELGEARARNLVEATGYNSSSPVKPSMEALITLEGFFGAEHMLEILGYRLIGPGVPAIRRRISKIRAKATKGGSPNVLSESDWLKLEEVRQFINGDLKSYAIAHSDMPMQMVLALFKPFEKMSFSNNQTMNDEGNNGSNQPSPRTSSVDLSGAARGERDKRNAANSTNTTQ